MTEDTNKSRIVKSIISLVFGFYDICFRQKNVSKFPSQWEKKLSFFREIKAKWFFFFFSFKEYSNLACQYSFTSVIIWVFSHFNISYYTLWLIGKIISQTDFFKNETSTWFLRSLLLFGTFFNIFFFHPFCLACFTWESCELNGFDFVIRFKNFCCVVHLMIWIWFGLVSQELILVLSLRVKMWLDQFKTTSTIYEMVFKFHNFFPHW